jgi:Protein kinase domain
MGFGTPAYMAPEQFKAKGKPLPESDQYALGCIAYELLTGQLPFTPDDELAYGFQHVFELPDSPLLLNPTLPLRVEQAVLTALAKSPAERHASVEAFLVALGIRRPDPTQVDLTSDATVGSSENPTLIKQTGETLTEGEITTELSPQRPVSTQQFAPTVLRATVPVQPTPIPTTTRPASPPFQMTGPMRNTIPSAASEGIAPIRQILSIWKRTQAITTGAPALTVAKWLFLLAALIDVPLLLAGFWFGPSFLTQAGTILAIGICICGLALNFFTEPWIWLVVFLLLSPLSGGLYTLAVAAFQVDHGIINWHTYCAYFLLTPAAGILYGLFGPTSRHEESMVPSFTKRLTLTIWFLGVGIFVVGFGAPMITYIGLAWALAGGILAAAQLIRLKQLEWLGTMVFVSAMAIGVPIFFWGFAYGAFGPTTEE